MTEPEATTWPLHPVPLGDSSAMSDDELLAALAAVHDAIPRLRDMERDLSVALGQRLGTVQGNLADGRQFTLKRTQDRKAWDHEDWKRDARRAIVQGVPKGLVLLDEDTGETQPLAPTLHVLLAEAQEVHGSTAPRSTALKRLGLYAADYCESSPGGWKFDAITPDPKPETTTEKDA